MKKSLFLLLSFFALVSCSKDDSSAPTFGTGPLEKVVFYRNSSNEIHWIFENKLLTKITLADGTLVEAFVYDALKRVIQDKKYTNGLLTGTDVITYNSDNTIKTINNLPYTFDAGTRTYTYTYGSDFTINCEVNKDFLAVNFTRLGSNPGEYHLTYVNDNMVNYQKISGGTTEEVKNYYFDAGFGGNPVYDMVLAVARVKSLTDPSFFSDCQVSKIVANGFDKGSSHPLYYNYGVIPDIEGNLFQIGVEVQDSDDNNVAFYSFADYYYL